MLDSVQSHSCRQLCETSHKLGQTTAVLAWARVAAVMALTMCWPLAAVAQYAPPPVPQGQPAPAPAHAKPAPAQPPAAEGGHAPVEKPASPGQPAAQDSHPAPAHGQPATPAHGAAQPDAHGAAGEHGEAHGESTLSFLSRIANFVILVGALYYFLHKPTAEYLASRSQQISGDLLTAKETSATAAAQLAEIDRKLQALPAEVAALEARGAEEIAAEEARIRQTAAAERQRLIEQTRREIDLQVRLAKRELTEQAAALAVEIATTQVKQTITPDDQARLIDRYVTQVKQAHD